MAIPFYRLMRAAVVFAAMILMTGGCDRQRPSGVRKPVIAASIFPVANLVQQLTGDWADLATLLPASQSPHDAELPPDQLRLLARADAVVVVGLGLDPWAEKAVAALGDTHQSVIRFGDLIAGATASGDSARHEIAGASAPKNNHLWLDPVLTIKFVEGLSTQLKGRYPEHADAIAAATKRLTADLHRIDQEYAVQLAAVPEKRLITYHNAFDLIAERYGLQIVVRLTDIESSPGGEVTPDRIREAIEAIQKYKLKTLYAEPEFPDQVIARLHEETGAEVLTLDPQGNPSVAGFRTYQEMMRSNLATLVKGQGGSLPSSQIK
ncbi:MAG TPA: metal ABC transporter substrate-binding protein [Pirellulales bacterium]|nr:metal ABC transporter substrate-binding protein [Pirellulales bacterium]